MSQICQEQNNNKTLNSLSYLIIHENIVIFFIIQNYIKKGFTFESINVFG